MGAGRAAGSQGLVLGAGLGSAAGRRGLCSRRSKNPANGTPHVVCVLAAGKSVAGGPSPKLPPRRPATGARPCRQPSASTTSARALNALLPAGAPHCRLITPVADRPGQDRRYAIDPTRTSTELGWQPRHSFEEGLVPAGARAGRLQRRPAGGAGEQPELNRDGSRTGKEPGFRMTMILELRSRQNPRLANLARFGVCGRAGQHARCQEPAVSAREGSPGWRGGNHCQSWQATGEAGALRCRCRIEATRGAGGAPIDHGAAGCRFH